MDRTNRGNGAADVNRRESGEFGLADTDNPTDDAAARLNRLRRLSHLLDSAVEIPGTKIRIGLDPLLGLLPGIGDATATAASAYVVAQAAALGAPRATIARMVLNLAVDALVGTD